MMDTKMKSRTVDIDTMGPNVKPLFPKGEDTIARPIRMVPAPAVLTPEDVAEAKRLCEREIEVCIKRRHVFRTFEIVYSVRRRFLRAGKPWLQRAMPDDDISDLSCAWRLRVAVR
jgi:hypothetical protein